MRSIPNRNRPIRLPKISRNRPLPTQPPTPLRLRPRNPRKDTHIQHARDQLNRPRQPLHLPNPILPTPILASRDVGLGEQGRGERGVDEEKGLVGFQRALLGEGWVEADSRVCAAEFFEF